jgi:hypothetical protein
MKGNDLKDKIGPCGLLCEKCFAFQHGSVQHHAEQLKNHLGNFDGYALRFSKLLNEPRFDLYPAFNDFLSYLSIGNCQGCRKQQCHLFSDCKVNQCYKDKNVDFCFQCDEFPCQHSGFDENLKLRWLKINERIRTVGLESYYDEVKDKPRY